MKKISTTLCLILFSTLFCADIFAYDIAVANADGVTIYYNYTNNGTELEVTYRSEYSYISGSYSGIVIIPETVSYMNRTRYVTSIGRFAFSQSRGLTSIKIPNSVTSIESYAFSICSGLTSITIPNSVTSIGKNAFEDCSGLTSITIPNSVTIIDDYAFQECTSLTTVTIGNSVTSIGKYAFRCCDSLTTVTIGNSVTSIGKQAFYKCSGLTSITIPNSVTSIGESAFRACTGLTSVTIPNSVTSIGESAFRACTGLTSITIGNSVTSIGESAFEDCIGLTSITIPKSVTSIERSAFGNINLAEIVSLIETPFAIYSNTFSQDTRYNATLYVPKGTLAKYKSTGGWKDFIFIEERDGSGNNADASKTCGDNLTWTYVEATKALTISGEGAMYDYGDNVAPWYDYRKEIASAILEPRVTTIGNYTFYECSGLTSVTIPNSVTSIGESAFRACTGLTSITIPNSVTSIGKFAFYKCSSLTSITIPDGVMSIGEWAFSSCSGLTSITVEESNPIYDSRNNCNAIIEKESSVLISGCKNTIIPDGVTSIGEFAFEDCSGLTSITIPNSVTNIERSAFWECSGLTSVTIPNSVTSIGSYAFAECPELIDVTCLAETVPTTHSKTFDGSSVEHATLHVPGTAIDAYKTTAPWSGFGKFVALTDQELSVDGITSDSIKEVSRYTIGGQRANQNTKGLNIVRMSDGTTKKVVVK